MTALPERRHAPARYQLDGGRRREKETPVAPAAIARIRSAVPKYEIPEERRRPAVAYHDARAQYESAHTASKNKGAADVLFWRTQTEVQGRRLAEEQIDHDMRLFDLDEYRRQLEQRYAALAERIAETPRTPERSKPGYRETAPEILDLAFVKQKMDLFAMRMDSDPKLQRRLRIEQERRVLAREAERIVHALNSKTKKRKTLFWLNPLHWKQMLKIDEDLAGLRREQEANRQQSILVTTTVFEKEMTGIDGGAWSKRVDRLSEIAIRSMDKRREEKMREAA